MKALEQFWLELSEGFVNLDKVTLSSSSSTPIFRKNTVPTKLLLQFAYLLIK